MNDFFLILIFQDILIRIEFKKYFLKLNFSLFWLILTKHLNTIKLK